MEEKNKIVNFPTNTVKDVDSNMKSDTTDRVLDSLYNIRLSLISMKIRGKTQISKSEFKNLLDNERTKSLEVEQAIDDLFSDLFEPKELVNKKLSLEEMIESAENSINKVSRDKVLTKTMPYFEHSNNNSKDDVA